MKLKLIDDWERVTREKKLARLACPPPSPHPSRPLSFPLVPALPATCCVPYVRWRRRALRLLASSSNPQQRIRRLKRAFAQVPLPREPNITSLLDDFVQDVTPPSSHLPSSRRSRIVYDIVYAISSV